MHAYQTDFKIQPHNIHVINSERDLAAIWNATTTSLWKWKWGKCEHAQASYQNCVPNAILKDVLPDSLKAVAFYI